MENHRITNRVTAHIVRFVIPAVVIAFAVYLFFIQPAALIVLSIVPGMPLAAAWTAQIILAEVLGRIHRVPPRVLRQNVIWLQVMRNQYDEFRELRMMIVSVQIVAWFLAMIGAGCLVFFLTYSP